MCCAVHFCATALRCSRIIKRQTLNLVHLVSGGGRVAERVARSGAAHEDHAGVPSEQRRALSEGPLDRRPAGALRVRVQVRQLVERCRPADTDAQVEEPESNAAAIRRRTRGGGSLESFSSPSECASDDSAHDVRRGGGGGGEFVIGGVHAALGEDQVASTRARARAVTKGWPHVARASPSACDQSEGRGTRGDAFGHVDALRERFAAAPLFYLSVRGFRVGYSTSLIPRIDLLKR